MLDRQRIDVPAGYDFCMLAELRHHPRRHRRVLDGFAQLLQPRLLRREVGAELRIREQLADGVIEAVGLHELVVEVERHRIAGGDRAGGQAERGEGRDVGGLHAVGLPVVEPDLGQRCDRLDRQVTLGHLRGGRTGRRVVRLDLALRRRADREARRGHRVLHVTADEHRDGGILERVAHERVGYAVLHGAEVDVRQRRLRNGRDDAGDPRHLVRQRFVDHDVARVGSLLQRHDPQQAEADSRVERQVVDGATDVRSPSSTTRMRYASYCARSR